MIYTIRLENMNTEAGSTERIVEGPPANDQGHGATLPECVTAFANMLAATWGEGTEVTVYGSTFTHLTNGTGDFGNFNIIRHAHDWHIAEWTWTQPVA